MFAQYVYPTIRGEELSNWSIMNVRLGQGVLARVGDRGFWHVPVAGGFGTRRLGADPHLFQLFHGSRSGVSQ